MLRRFIATLFAACAICIASLGGISHARTYTEQQLLDYYGLRPHGDAELGLIREMFPPVPVPFIDVLPPANDPGMSKKVKTMSGRDIDAIVRNTADKVNDFWKNVFRAHGRIYTPAPIRLTHLKKGPGNRGIYFDPGIGKNGVIHIDRNDMRDFAGRASGAMIRAVVAHEIGHSVAHQLRLYVAAEKNPARVLKKILALRPSIEKYPMDVYIEMQANFLSGVSLKGAGLLNQDDPEEIYYGTALSGDDFGALVNGFCLPKNYTKSTHGRGKDQAAAIWEGMQTGDAEKGLRLLGIAPDWSPLKKAKR